MLLPFPYLLVQKELWKAAFEAIKARETGRGEAMIRKGRIADATLLAASPS